MKEDLLQACQLPLIGSSSSSFSGQREHHAPCHLWNLGTYLPVHHISLGHLGGASFSEIIPTKLRWQGYNPSTISYRFYIPSHTARILEHFSDSEPYPGSLSLARLVQIPERVSDECLWIPSGNPCRYSAWNTQPVLMEAVFPLLSPSVCQGGLRVLSFWTAVWSLLRAPLD